MRPVFIVVTGGVLSGLGKGVAAASLGFLLSRRHRIIPVKCDGYLNTDPGTMNPVEHGEVFVLDDGGEVDMDFGHYERFLDVSCKSEWNLTMGKVFHRIWERERRGDYLGKTVQLIPHVTDLIKDWWFRIAKEEAADVILLEVGGTVGDMENELFLEAARQLRRDPRAHRVLYVHLTYVPVPHNVNEQKSKPTQMSVNILREKGINPDLIIARCEQYLDEGVRRKIALYADIAPQAVLTGVDVGNIYEIPLVFARQGLPRLVRAKTGLSPNRRLQAWARRVRAMQRPRRRLRVAIAGKYTRLEDSYASVIEALAHAGAALGCGIDVEWLETSDRFSPARALGGVSGVIVPGGFGSRGVEGKIRVIEYCRTHRIPFLGLCYGMQLAVIEYARHACRLRGAHTTEVGRTRHPVVDFLPGQEAITDKGGTMRLGAYPAHLKAGTLVKRLYGAPIVSERHRHRYEINPAYVERLERAGLVFSGKSPDGTLMEFMELPGHPFFVGTQAHPELKSSLLAPAPLFLGLVKAALQVRPPKPGHRH